MMIDTTLDNKAAYGTIIDRTIVNKDIAVMILFSKSFI